MQDLLLRISDRLASTQLSQTILTTPGIVPGFQTLHILAIAVIMTTSLLVSLRALNVVLVDHTPAQVASRYLRWVWYALPVLLASGAILIVGEPHRSLGNAVFQLKMIMLVVAMGMTLLLQRSVVAAMREVAVGAGMRLLALGCLALWSGIVLAGRWIAYSSSLK